jgi:hypothetical protein
MEQIQQQERLKSDANSKIDTKRKSHSQSGSQIPILIYAMRGDPVHPISSSHELARAFGNSERNRENEQQSEIEVVEFDRMHYLETEQAKLHLQRFAKL